MAKGTRQEYFMVVKYQWTWKQKRFNYRTHHDRGGEWYLPLTKKEIESFLESGWRIGIYLLALSNYRIKLDRIEKFIKVEVNGRKNPKQIQSLKSSRQRILERYSKIKNELNQLNQLN